MNIRQLNNTISIADLLAKEGILPEHKRGADWWYISPIRPQERTASFKVNIEINRWHDHGIGEGGKLFDLALRLYPSLTISQVIQKLDNLFSFQPPYSPTLYPQPASPKADNQLSFADERKKIRVVSAGPITSPALIHYLGQRKIPVELAQKYCREVQYELHDKQYYAIGFANDAGGYELRNPYFKGSSSPKGVTFFDNGVDQVSVFEGFFDFLSYQTLNQYLDQPPANVLVLNSLSFFQKSRPVMEKHEAINLYLDRDTAGMNRTTQMVKENPSYKDCSLQYQDCKDLNQWLIQNFLQVQRDSQALKRAKGITDDILNEPVARNRQRGHRL